MWGLCVGLIFMVEACEGDIAYGPCVGPIEGGGGMPAWEMVCPHTLCLPKPCHPFNSGRR